MWVDPANSDERRMYRWGQVCRVFGNFDGYEHGGRKTEDSCEARTGGSVCNEIKRRNVTACIVWRPVLVRFTGLRRSVTR